MIGVTRAVSRRCGPGRRRILLLLAAVLLLPAGAGTGRAAEPRAGKYLKPIRMPGEADPFRQPLAIHSDPHTGELFVCDMRNHRIAIFDENGLFTFEVAGGSIFRSPLDVATDSEGHIVVLAYVGGVVGLVQLDYDGRFMKRIELSGWPEDARDPLITSIALSTEDDRIYLLDQRNLRLWMADRDGKITGFADFSGGLSDKDAEEQQTGRVRVYGDTVLVALPTAGSIRILDRDGSETGHVGQKGTAPCQTAMPVSGALDGSGNVVMVDKQRMLMMVWRIRDNVCLGEFSGIGSFPGSVYQPTDIAMDSAGRVIVTQGFDGRVQVFDYTPPSR